MALTTPILVSPNPFSALSDYTFSFSSIGGSQVCANQLEVQINSDSTQVYLTKVESFLFKHTVSAGTLTNSTEFKARIRTYDSDDNYSDWSEWVVFWCFAAPVVSVTNLSNVNNQTFEFTGSYSSDDSLNSYRFLLYNKDQVLIESFDEVFSTTLTQEITNLEKNTKYYIQLKTLSVNDLLGDSGLLEFTPNYIQPKLQNTLTLTNVPASGSILCQANIIQILGKMYPTEGEILTYIDSEWVDLTDGNQVKFESGFSVDTDFLMKIWCKSITTDTVFLTLFGEYGKIELKLKNNRVYAYKLLNNSTICSLFASNELISITSTDTLFIWLKQINNSIDIQIALIT